MLRPVRQFIRCTARCLIASFSEPKERPTAEELKKHPYLMTRAGWTFTPGTIPGGRVNNRPPGQS